MRVLFRALAVTMLLAAIAPSAQAETNKVRVARQVGLGYLQLYVAEKQKLIEKHAAAAGLGPVEVTYSPIGNPSSIIDAVVSGSVDLGGSGVPPFLLLFDKTRNSVQVKALTALNAQPAFLNSINPDVHSVADFGPKDRIAVPAAKSSFQAILLQMAAEQRFGAGEHNKLDAQTVSMTHPDGTVALLAGRTEVTAHFTSPPYQYQQLRDSKVHRVLSSYEITGPATFSVLWTTARFHDANPRLSRAIIAAIEEATDFIRANPEAAARIFIEVEKSTLPVDFVRTMLVDPDIRYAVTPENILKFTSFMARAGTITSDVPRWQDLFFPELHDRTGS